MLLAIAIALAAATVEPPVQDAPGGFRFAGIPGISYGSDVGLRLGGAALLYRPSGVEGRLERVSLGASWSSRGPRVLELRWDAPRLFDAGWGAWLDLRLADDSREPYWGEGGTLGGAGVEPGFGDPPDPYRYHDRRAQLSVTFRRATAAAPSPFLRLRWLGLAVLEQGALLASAQPPGAGGGDELLGEAGLFVDTRDRDTGTHRGVLASASLFGAPRLGPLSDGAFVGANATAAAYLPVGERVTLAARVLHDRRLGEVPFYERAQYEGLLAALGLGGADTIRGLALARLAGDEKGLASVELRAMLPELRPTARSLQLGAAAGIDAGYARQSGYAALGAVGGFLGLRVLVDRAVLLRVEVGWAGHGGPAIYLATGEQF